MGRFTALIAAAAFLVGCNKSNTTYWDNYGPRPPTGGSSPYATTVFEYTPAPGQFINDAMSGFTEAVTTAEQAVAYAEGRLNANAYISLGGFGGYIVVGFDHSVQARASYYDYDFSITGNQFKGSSEAGIVWVMQDLNGNGEPDDEVWYELKGSEHEQSLRDYCVTYFYPADDGDPVAWRDSEGNNGFISRTSQHTQNYFPAWIEGEPYTLTGTRLPSIEEELPDGNYSTGDYGWGYADNYGKDMIEKPKPKNFFRISDAIDASGAPVELKYIDFVKVQTGVNVQGGGGVGELSTEVERFTDENLSR